jgi:hypothetical protein
MIRIERHDGRACPFLYCDQCGEKIRDTGAAVAAWRAWGATVSIVHKGACLDRYEREWCEEPSELCTEELDAHLYYLARNHGVEAKRPKRLECE